MGEFAGGPALSLWGRVRVLRSHKPVAWPKDKKFNVTKMLYLKNKNDKKGKFCIAYVLPQ